MVTTTIEWYSPAEKLPKPNTDMVLINTGHNITSVYYSSKHELFNANNYESRAEAESTAINPLYWAYMPELPEDESEDE